MKDSNEYIFRASPPKGEWTSSDEGKTNGFDKFKNGNRIVRT